MGGVIGLLLALMFGEHIGKIWVVVALIYFASYAILLASVLAFAIGITYIYVSFFGVQKRETGVALLIGGLMVVFLFDPNDGILASYFELIGICTIFAIIGYIVGKPFDTIAEEKDKKRQQYLQTVPGLFDTAKSLSSQANKFFQQKNYPEALKTYETALNNFTRAHEGAEALNDTELTNSISNNISTLRKNIAACKNALGADIASKARSKFEKGDFTGAIQTYNESLKYFQDVELISKTKANIENCYIEIDVRKVEELSAQASSSLKEAAALNEPFKAIEKLNQANNKLNDAVALATKRKFADALSQLNTISKTIQDQRNIVHERLSNEPVISEKWEVEQLASKKAPAIHAVEYGSRLKALRESEFFNGFIRLRLSVGNKMSHTVTDVLLDIDLDEIILRLDHYEPDTYAIRKGKILLGNITPNNDKTIAVYLDPLTCSKEGTDVNCRIDYKDAYGKSDSIRMEPLKIPFTCPIFDTEQDINIGRLKELVASLPAHGSKVFSLSKGVEIAEAIALCREVIQMHDVRHVRTFKTTDGKTIETWYYGKTKVEKIDLVIKASVNKETGIDVFVAAPDQKALTGLLAELGGNITEKGKSLGKFTPELNLIVRGSAVSKKRLLDLCDKFGNCGANVVMEDSVLY
ncbi:MAG: hypothetical protein WAW23_01700 [Candidatus Methanoperedens sp.]